MRKAENDLHYTHDGIPCLTFPNTPDMQWDGQWHHKQGSGLHPNDYPEIGPAFYRDKNAELHVHRPAPRSRGPLPGPSFAQPQKLMPAPGPRAPHPNPYEGHEGEEWTVGRVAGNIWNGLTDPRLAEGAKTAAKYGLLGAGLGGAAVVTTAAAGAAGAAYGPAVVAAAAEAGLGAAARIGAAGAAGAAQLKRGAEALNNGYRSAQTWAGSPQGQTTIKKTTDFIDGLTPGVPPASTEGYAGAGVAAAMDILRQKKEK